MKFSLKLSLNELWQSWYGWLFPVPGTTVEPHQEVCYRAGSHYTLVLWFISLNAIWEPAKKEHSKKGMFITWKYVISLAQVGWVLGTPNVPNVRQGKSVQPCSRLYSKSKMFSYSWNVKNDADSLYLYTFACLVNQQCATVLQQQWKS